MIRPTWLANAHAALDRAACGWPGEEVTAEVAEDVILSRLLELKRQRSGESQAAVRRHDLDASPTP